MTNILFTQSLDMRPPFLPHHHDRRRLVRFVEFERRINQFHCRPRLAGGHTKIRALSAVCFAEIPIHSYGRVKWRSFEVDGPTKPRCNGTEINEEWCGIFWHGMDKIMNSLLIEIIIFT